MFHLFFLIDLAILSPYTNIYISVYQHFPMKILVGYPPTEDSKGTPLLSQNRQFQYFNNPTFLFPVALATAATMLKDKNYKIFWKDAIAEGVGSDEFYRFLESEKLDLFLLDRKSTRLNSSH